MFILLPTASGLQVWGNKRHSFARTVSIDTSNVSQKQKHSLDELTCLCLCFFPDIMLLIILSTNLLGYIGRISSVSAQASTLPVLLVGRLYPEAWTVSKECVWEVWEAVLPAEKAITFRGSPRWGCGHSHLLNLCVEWLLCTSSSTACVLQDRGGKDEEADDHSPPSSRVEGQLSSQWKSDPDKSLEVAERLASRLVIWQNHFPT